MGLNFPFNEEAFRQSVNRRTFLTRSAYGLGGLALAGLFNPKLLAGETPVLHGIPGAIQPPHFPPKAKRVIHLCMAGGPSHLEAFDYKPELKELDGKPFPESFTKGQQLAQLQERVAEGARAVCGVRQVRQVRAGDFQLVPAHRRHRRRHLHRALDAHRADQPRPGARLHEHRLDHQGPAEHGLVAALRAGRGDRQPAGLRRAHVAGKVRRCSRSRRGNGRRGSCPAVTRASNSNRGATPSTTSAIPTASARARSGR